MSELQTPIRHRTVLDDEARAVSRIYAEALYRAAEQAGQVDDTLTDLETLVQDVFGRDPGLELFFASAAVGRESKKAAIAKAFGDRANSVFVQFLEVLNDHERLDLLSAIAGAFRALHERKCRRLPVQVRSAVPLTDAERQRICDDVRAAADLEPILQESVDPEILGGLIIRVGDWVYDASVRTRLETIRNQLIERSSHGIQSGRNRFSAG